MSISGDLPVKSHDQNSFLARKPLKGSPHTEAACRADLAEVSTHLAAGRGPAVGATAWLTGLRPSLAWHVNWGALGSCSLRRPPRGPPWVRTVSFGPTHHKEEYPWLWTSKSGSPGCHSPFSRPQSTSSSAFRANLASRFWAKRDDVSSGLAFGGNKIRKLEWLAADALAQGCDTLVSIGNVQSNHTRQVAAVAAVLGLRCRLVQEEWDEMARPRLHQGGQHLALAHLGRRDSPGGRGLLHRHETDLGAGTRGCETGGRKTLRHTRRRVRPTTALAGPDHAHFADELATEEEALGLFFDTVVTATRTGSTKQAWSSASRPRPGPADASASTLPLTQT